jgi:kumamolisin
MFRHPSHRLLINFALVAAYAASMASGLAAAAVPYPTAATPAATDMGPLSAAAGTTPVSLTVVLRLTDPDGAEALLKAVSTPGDPLYHQFLSAQQFSARFAPAAADVGKVIAGFQRYGLSAVQETATTLKVTGSPAAVEAAFGVSLQSYQVAAHGRSPGYNFHAPLSRATLPAEVAGAIAGVIGLDSRPSFRPLNSHAVAPRAATRPVPAASTSLNPPGLLTVTDFASLYDVGPLYDHGASGRGRTIGILSLAGFTPSDAFAYWSAVGLTVNPNRIQIVNVDGGPGAPSDDSGSIETTLDVEQSGGIAPAANMIVYLAPNTTQAFVDVFAAAIEANRADSLSISWGEWEWFDNLQNSPAVDPLTGRVASTTTAVHQLLVRAAIQGQTVFTAAGDGGAYEANNDLGCNGPYSPSQPLSCSLTLSVDYPASDPAITAAGGTTLPGEQDYCLNSACTPPYYVVNIAHERVWGWDYLEGLCSALGISVANCGIQYAGGGGGVSINFGQPQYQAGLPGVQWSQPGQFFIAGKGFGPGLYYALPAFFPGRNVPDVSANADPDTGYVILYTSSVNGFEEATFYGGTSFVAPQFNGVTALLDQSLHGRLGLLNYALYSAPDSNTRGASLHPIAYGNNWFYYGRNGYSPAAGLGVLDVANFEQFLQGGL